MRVRDAVAELRTGRLPATALLYGESAYVREIGLDQLMSAMPVDMPDLNVTIFEGRPSMTQLRDALGKPPFMSDRKTVVLRSTDLFAVPTSAAISKPIEQMVLDEHTLFIIDAGEKLDRRKGAVKHLMRDAMLIECESLKGDALSGYVTTLARKRKLHMGHSTADSLIERCSGDLFTITSELDKLRCVSNGEITAEELDRYCPPLPDAGVFEILDLFLTGQSDKAWQAVTTFLADGESPLGFLSLLAKSFKQMLIARTCRDANYNYQKTVTLVCSETGAREWTAKRAYERSAHLTADALRNGLRRLADLDFGIKQGYYEPASDLYGILFGIFARK